MVDTKKPRVVTVRFTAEQAERLERLARQRGETPSEVIRRFVLRHGRTPSGTYAGQVARLAVGVIRSLDANSPMEAREACVAAMRELADDLGVLL